MSTPDDEHQSRLGMLHEGEHLNALERLDVIARNVSPGHAAGMCAVLAKSATRTGTALQKFAVSESPTGPRGPAPKGTLSSPS